MAASIKEVAARAGVAVGTVSNVLNHPDRVSPPTLERVMNAVEALGFVRNDAARQLRAGQSRTIGMIVLDSSNPFFAAVARAAENEATRHGADIILGNSGSDPEREARYVTLFEEQRVQGVLISPSGNISSRLRSLRDRGVAAVLVDSESEPAVHSSVSVDDTAGGFMAAEHLLETGRRRLAFVGGSPGIRQVADRLAGARSAVDRVPGARLEVLQAADMTVLAGRAVGQDLVERGRSELPEAIFCANDLLAVGVLQSLLLINGLRVPQDVALMGYDDIDFAQSTVVPLSSIRQPAEEIGRTAVQLLQEQLGDTPSPPRQVRFTPELVARQSTGPSAASA
ncbi:LacI family DNA-binding transcriptional regulator [Arthrobacter sp. Z1-15]